uniref:N-acetyltransferase domain-containing protein n=1 Tax=Gongylonema pulchrum TaxID=637853 RepID=A0A183DYZ9_9BILA
LTGSERLSLEDEYDMQMKWREDDDKCTFIILSRKLIDSGVDEIGSMVGDVNIFIRDGVGELEIMIAEPECRSQGLGREATQMMLKYAVETLGLNEFQVKITDDNAPSISLFQKLGFVIVSHSDVFREQTLTADFEKLQNIISQQCLHYGTLMIFGDITYN